MTQGVLWRTRNGLWHAGVYRKINFAPTVVAEPEWDSDAVEGEFTDALSGVTREQAVKFLSDRTHRHVEIHHDSNPEKVAELSAQIRAHLRASRRGFLGRFL